MIRYEGSPAVVIERRKGTPDSPFSNMNESLVVTGDGKVLLSEIPNELNKVVVTSDDNATWYEVKDGILNENAFKVDYINKLVTFNIAHVGKQFHFKYVGEGNHYYSPHSIYTKLEDESVVETLGGLIESGQDALDALVKLDEKLDEVTEVTNDARDLITEGTQVISDAKDKVTEINGKINEATSKIEELDIELEDAKNTVADVKEQSAIVEDIITNGQGVIDNAQLIINEVKSVGKFNLATAYKKNNTVIDNGSTWIVLKDTQNNPLPVLPIIENTYWRLVALHGEKGLKGDTGAALSILGKLTDESQLPPTGNAGEAYTINGELYVWSENLNTWENVGNIKGEKGDTGATGDTGKSAYQEAVDNGFIGTLEEWLISLKGEKGDPGKDADLTEVNQKIVTLQQTVTDDKQVVTEHLAEKGQANGYASLDASGKVPANQLSINIVDATTTQKGIVQLNDTLTSTSTTQAATANAVKMVNDKILDTGWIIATVKPGWALYDVDSLQYRKIGESVFLRGGVSKTTGGTDVITVLPDGFYPAFGAAIAGQGQANVRVTPYGNVTCTASVNFDGVYSAK